MHVAATIPAVVVGADLGGLGAARSLWSAGVPTIMIDTSWSKPAMWSRSCRAVVVNQLYGPGLIQALLDLHQRIGRAVLILTDELATETVSKLRKDLDGAY